MAKKDDKGKIKLTRKEILTLILASYRASLPFIVIFILAMLLVTWLITEVFL